MGKLSNKVALVTGGNSGIGLATAKLYREEGAKVIITASSASTFEKAKQEYGSVFEVVQADVSKVEELDRLYSHVKAKYGKFDVLFANAGIAKFSATGETSPEFFDSIFDVNVRGLYFTVQKALPLLNAGSSVVITGSVVSIKGFPGSGVYSATKAAVRNFVRTWTAEIPPTHTRFNVVSPGPIDTPIFDKAGMPDEQKHGMIEILPMKRFGKPDEIASVALFLAGADSSYVAGTEIFADGGFGQV